MTRTTAALIVAALIGALVARKWPRATPTPPAPRTAAGQPAGRQQPWSPPDAPHPGRGGWPTPAARRWVQR